MSTNGSSNGVHASNGAGASNGAHDGVAGSHGMSPGGLAELRAPLDLEALFRGKRFVVVGGTGYLGKTWWSFLLANWPSIEHLYLLVREKGKQSAEERFWQEIVPTAVFDPLRAAHGERFERR